MVGMLNASKARARTKKLVRTGLMIMLLVAGGVVVGESLLTQNNSRYGGISCAECKSHFAEYNGHVTGRELLENLDLVSSMAAHLASCQSCQFQFNENYPGLLQEVASVSALPTIRNSFPLLVASRRPVFY